MNDFVLEWGPSRIREYLKAESKEALEEDLATTRPFLRDVQIIPVKSQAELDRPVWEETACAA